MDELYKMTTDDVEDRGSVLVVSLPETKTKKKRVFTVISEGFGVNVLDIYRKYLKLRPKHTTHKSLFVNYREEKCTTQRVGINTLSKVPCKIAMFLKLGNPERFTGHCFRRSSATLLAEAGGDLLSLKRHGGWKSSSVVEGYIEDSITTKLDVCEKILLGGKVEACGGKSTLAMSEMVGQPVFNFVDCENVHVCIGSDKFPKTSV